MCEGAGCCRHLLALLQSRSSFSQQPSGWLARNACSLLLMAGANGLEYLIRLWGAHCCLQNRYYYCYTGLNTPVIDVYHDCIAFVATADWSRDVLGVRSRGGGVAEPPPWGTHPMGAGAVLAGGADPHPSQQG
jgi:hypothetical protein